MAAVGRCHQLRHGFIAGSPAILMLMASMPPPRAPMSNKKKAPSYFVGAFLLLWNGVVFIPPWRVAVPAVFLRLRSP